MQQSKLEANNKINELFQNFHLGLVQVLASFYDLNSKISWRVI